MSFGFNDSGSLESIAKSLESIATTLAQDKRALNETEALRQALERERNERKAVEAQFVAFKASADRWRRQLAQQPSVDLKYCSVCGKVTGPVCYVTDLTVRCEDCHKALKMDGEDMMPLGDGNVEALCKETPK